LSFRESGDPGVFLQSLSSSLIIFIYFKNSLDIKSLHAYKLM
jgi:hypothetical protein